MREIDRHIKDGKKGRNYSGECDRPKWFFSDGVNHPIPPEFYSDKPCTRIPVDDYGMQSLATRKYLDDPGRSSQGLNEDRVWQMFEHDRSQWPSLGYISPYKNHPGRKRRDDQEFVLWRHWNKGRVARLMDQDFDEEPDWPYDYAVRGKPPGVSEYAHRRDARMPYQTRRRPRVYNRPQYQRGPIDYRDPKYRPPVPPNAMNSIPRATNRLPSSLYQNISSRHSHRHPADIRLPNPRTNRASHPAYGIRGYGEPLGQLGPHTVDNRGHRQRRGNPFIYDDELQDEERTEFITRHPSLHRQPRIRRPHHFLDDGEEEDEEDTRSHFSTGSYDRVPPQIVYPPIPPYYGRPLDHDPEFELDDEDEDELFRPNGEYLHSKRGPYGIGIGREGRRVRAGRRGYDREDLDYEFSGDEDDFFRHL